MVTFVDPNAAEQFNCVICQSIFREPVQIGCEGHVFCKECILELISCHGHTFDCPMCRKTCHSKSINRVPFIDRQINNLMAKCPNHEISVEKKEYLDVDDSDIDSDKENIKNTNSSNQQTLRRSKRLISNKKQTISGHKRKRSENNVTNNNKKRKLNGKELCDWIGSLSDLQDHIRRCPLELISCEYCDLKMLQRDSEQHYDECECFPSECDKCGESAIARINMTMHIGYHCPMTWIQCRQQCDVTIQRKDEDKHIQNDCDETMVNCHFHSFGCDSIFKRKDISAHNARYAHSHLVRVEQQNKQLHRVNKEIQHQMQRENKEIQHQLQRENKEMQHQMQETNIKILKENQSLKSRIDLMEKTIFCMLNES